MTQEHPITPPPELVREWGRDANLSGVPYNDEHWAYEHHIATRAAQWGADQELEACCHLLRLQGFDVVDDLRATRRPKPPSLKKQALEELSLISISPESGVRASALDTIRRALERLQELEGGND